MVRAHNHKRSPWRTGRATLLAALLLATLNDGAWARHSYDRQVGYKTGYRPTRSERRRNKVIPLVRVTSAGASVRVERRSPRGLGRDLRSIIRQPTFESQRQVIESLSLARTVTEQLQLHKDRGFWEPQQAGRGSQIPGNTWPEEAALSQTARRLQGLVKATPVKGSRIIEIEVKHPDTAQAARMARAMAQAYAAYQDVPISIPKLGRLLQQLQRRNPDRMRLTVLQRINGLPMYRVDLSDPTQREAGTRKLPVFVSAGIHGNEPTSVLAAVQLIKRALHDKSLLKHYDFTILPDLNPVGLTVGQRLNGPEYDLGTDANRSFGDGRRTRESAAVRQGIGDQKFFIAMDTHGWVSNGFGLYRNSNDRTVSRRALSALQTGLLLDPVGPSGHALGGVQEPYGQDLESFMAQRAKLSYTLEYPRSMDVRRQLRGMTKLMLSTLNNARRHGRFQDAAPR